MSIIDKVIAAVTPPETDEARAEARAKAEAAARPGDWLSTILSHHRELEALFAAVKSATSSSARRTAQKQLGVILIGHANAEETVVYPAMTVEHQVGHAAMAFEEQAAAKTEMALLEKLDPMSEDYLDKLEHIRGAVAHHMYSEEGTWFLQLSESASDEDQKVITERYNEEFERYVGDPIAA